MGSVAESGTANVVFGETNNLIVSCPLPVFPPNHLLQPRTRPGADVALGGGDGGDTGHGCLLEYFPFPSDIRTLTSNYASIT